MESKSKLLILEDQSLMLMDLVDRVSSFFDFDIIQAKSPSEALDVEPDIAICDIQLGDAEMDGIDVANMLNKERQVPVIFLTKVQDDSSVFERISATKYPKFYLSKPISNNALRVSLIDANKVKDNYPNEEGAQGEISLKGDLEVLSDRVFVRSGKEKNAFFLEDILWVQSGGGEVSAIVTKDKLAEGNGYYPTIGLNLGKVEERLKNKLFLRVSRFHLVSLKQISKILDKPNGKKALMIQGNEIPVGEKYRKEITKRLEIW